MIDFHGGYQDAIINGILPEIEVLEWICYKFLILSGSSEDILVQDLCSGCQKK